MASHTHAHTSTTRVPSQIPLISGQPEVTILTASPFLLSLHTFRHGSLKRSRCFYLQGNLQKLRRKQRQPMLLQPPGNTFSARFFALYSEAAGTKATPSTAAVTSLQGHKSCPVADKLCRSSGQVGMVMILLEVRMGWYFLYILLAPWL